MNKMIKVKDLISLSEKSEKRFLDKASSAKHPEVKDSFLKCAAHARRLADKYREIDSSTVSAEEFDSTPERKELSNESFSRHNLWQVEQWVDMELSQTLMTKGKERTCPWTEKDVERLLEDNNCPYKVANLSGLVVQFEKYRAASIS